MIPFLGIDLTTDKKNEQTNGSEFLIQKTNTSLKRHLESSLKKAIETIDKTQLPLLLLIIEYLCIIVALLIICGILKADVPFSEGYHNAPWLYWTAGICAVIGVILWMWGKYKEKKSTKKEEFTQTFSHLDGVADSIYKELSVPDNAKDVDILSFYYKIKDGTIKVQEKGWQFAKYLNPEFKIFTDTENLYLANLEGKYAISLSSITTIRTVKKHISIDGWNKEEKYNKGIYKQYKLTTNNYGMICCKSYHILEIKHQGETYGVYFPCYELPVFEEFTGLKAQIN